jgi:hypothetical protein
MLIQGGYTHSLKRLLEKSRAEELELAARCAHGDRFEMAYPVRVMNWVAWVWTMTRLYSSGGRIR